MMMNVNGIRTSSRVLSVRPPNTTSTGKLF
jgi:hypothetical protein